MQNLQPQKVRLTSGAPIDVYGKIVKRPVKPKEVPVKRSILKLDKPIFQVDVRVGDVKKRLGIYRIQEWDHSVREFCSENKMSAATQKYLLG